MLSLVAAMVMAFPSPVTPQSTAGARQNAIWAAVYNRINTQIDVWWDQGDFPKVINLIAFQAELFPNDYDVATNLGWMWDNIKEDSKAEAAYARYAKRNPNDPDATLPVIQKAWIKKDYKKVISLGSTAINRKGVHANVYRLLAHSYRKTGDLKSSLRVWDKYLAINPKDLTAIKNREQVKKQLGG